MQAALLNEHKEVVGHILQAPEAGHEIDVAVTFTADGTPINVRSMKISRSKRNMAKAYYLPTYSKIGIAKWPNDVYTSALYPIAEEF